LITSGIFPSAACSSAESLELFPPARECRDDLVACGEENPSPESQPLAGIEDALDDLGFLAQPRDTQGEGCIARVARDRRLVVDDANRYPFATETSDDPEALVVASQHDRTHRAHAFVVTATANRLHDTLVTS
jgi:hypothetical protein